MSKATKRKHVTREVLDDYPLPQENQQIVKVTASRGNNLHEVQTATGDQFLVSMPTRFRKNVWIKRGDFVIVDPILEGDKVKAEIATILYPKQIKYIQKERLWPDQFTSKPLNGDLEKDSRDDDLDEGTDSIAKDMAEVSLKEDGGSLPEGEEDESSSEEDNDDDLFVNTNRPSVTYYYSDSEEDSEDEDDAYNEDGER